MKKQRLTPRGDRRLVNRSVSPQNIGHKAKGKQCFPASKNLNKQNTPGNAKDSHSLKICLDLASYHKKEAEEMKVKNLSLEEKLKQQGADMQNLRNQLQKIKLSIQNSTSRKELEVLKSENSSLRDDNRKIKEEIAVLKKQLEEAADQNLHLKSKCKQTESMLIDSQAGCQNGEISSFTVAKMSRRQQYANKYESISFVPSIRCLECARKDNQLEEARTKYSNQLKELQEQVKTFLSNQVALEVMQKQLLSKNECIDYLIKQLNSLQSDSQAILHSMTYLQEKMKDMAEENTFLKTSGPIRMHQSFSKTVA